MTNLQPGMYTELASSYRDIALLKALYWRMLPLFRWLCHQTAASFIQSPIYSLLKDLANVNSDEELDAALNSDSMPGVKANLDVLEQHLTQFMPSMVGKFKPGDVRHKDTHRKKSFTRQQMLIN
mmetsp:Transcript_7424/g.10533  ORF Transcript_7424/g.10533 Transcript_7424/m.10533 type:complete len:124 (+) Transcript_7424:3044-3415(+)